MQDGTASSSEAFRQLGICHACRYCEGYCDAFGTLSRLPLLAEADVPHLATICHDCRACYQACMYTEPHEFALNIPAALAAVRESVYEDNAPPAVLGRAQTQPWGLAACATFLTLAALVYIVSTKGAGA